MTTRPTTPAITPRSARNRSASETGVAREPGKLRSQRRLYSQRQGSATGATGAGAPETPGTPETPETMTPTERAEFAERAALLATASALEARRRALRCAQATLARSIGVSATTVARVLRGDPADAMSLRGRQSLRRRLMALALALDAYEAQATAAARMEHPKAKIKRTLPRAKGDGASGAAGGARPATLRTMKRFQAPGAPAVSATPDTVAPASMRGKRMAQAAVAVAARPQLATYRILIVEDDPDVVAIYRLALAEATTDEDGYAARYVVTVVATASACVAALLAAQASGRPYDLLLMDLSLRDIHTDEPQSVAPTDVPSEVGEADLVTTLARAGAPLPRGRLVVSGMAPYHLRRMGQRLAGLGAAYLPKPFDIATLLAAVYALCAPNAQSAPDLAYFT